ncbi:50S ribosomal protein L19e [Halohasta salina]|uniref:50S ribosomal protein L19e n=1 Tax=Halohasta salina TaxID=2961621 RepID=UPI0020A5D764|nr:50S ribosomal protein L19e [Halohasta salina]
MSDLGSQKRLAADVLGVGKGRVWLDPDEQEEIAEAITREDIRDLVDQGIIQTKDTQGNSRGRARERDAKRSYGHKKGQGKRKGKSGARESRKDSWVSRIRAQRKRLKELREEGTIDRTQYRELYNKASGGEFDSVDRLEAFVRTNYGIEVNA